MCHVGGIEDEVDTEGPSAECCRVYEFSGFKGRQMDFCVYDIVDRPETFAKYWQADTYGWHNEINSFWCGADVAIRICAHPDDSSSTEDKAAVGECRPGNPNVLEDNGKQPQVPDPINEEGDSIWIFKMPENACPVYELPNC